MIKYDNYRYCKKCAGINDVKVVDTINQHISECKTECKDCGFCDYWAHGFFESRIDDKELEREVNK